MPGHKKSRRHQPTKRTIQGAKPKVVEWTWPPGLLPYRHYRLSKRFRLTALRGALIQVLHPVTPKGKKYVVKLSTTVNKQWKEGETLHTFPSDIVDPSKVRPKRRTKS